MIDALLLLFCSLFVLGDRVYLRKIVKDRDRHAAKEMRALRLLIREERVIGQRREERDSKTIRAQGSALLRVKARPDAASRLEDEPRAPFAPRPTMSASASRDFGLPGQAKNGHGG